MNQLKATQFTGEYPTTKQTLEFLQSAVLEALRGLGTGFGGENVRLSGALVTETDAGGGNKTVTWSEGFVLLSGEVYYVPENLTGITGASSLPVHWVPVVTNDPVLDPAQYRDPITGDLTERNVHNIRRAQPTLDAGAPGAVADAELISPNLGQAWNVVSLPTGYASLGTEVPVRWRRRQDGMVEIEGAFLRTSSGTDLPTFTLFTLPVGSRPAFNHKRILYYNDYSATYVWIEVYTDGRVQIRNGPPSGNGLYIGGFSFHLA